METIIYTLYVREWERVHVGGDGKEEKERGKRGREREGGKREGMAEGERGGGRDGGRKGEERD